MKNNTLIIASFLFSTFLFSQNAFNRNNTMVNPNQNFEPTKEEIEKTREDNLNKLVTELTEDLNLDALQVVAIRQIYADKIKKQGIILKKEESEEYKSKALKSLSESTEEKVIALLNPQQKEKYELLKNDVESGKEKKKEKSKNKKKKE